jgi:hypothetical protein
VVHTDREVTANRPDIIIKNKKEKTCTLTDVAIPADKCCAKGSGKEVKIQDNFKVIHPRCVSVYLEG